MRDGVIYVRDSVKRYNARDVLSVIGDNLDADDNVSLGELCRMIEAWAERVSFDQEDDDDAR